MTQSTVTHKQHFKIYLCFVDLSYQFSSKSIRLVSTIYKVLLSCYFLFCFVYFLFVIFLFLNIGVKNTDQCLIDTE